RGGEREVVEEARGAGLGVQRLEPVRAERDAIGELARAARGVADPALERAELLARRLQVSRRSVETPGGQRREQRRLSLLGELLALGREVGAPGVYLALGAAQARRERARPLAGAAEPAAQRVDLMRERPAREQCGVAGRPRRAEDTGHARLRGEYPRELVERVETVDGAQRVRAVGGLRQLDRRDQWRDRGRVEVGSERLPAALRGAAVGYVELELERGFEREPAPHD